MTKITKLIWRLRDSPTAENLQELVESGLLTKDEAREILFSLQTEEDRDVKSLESEIKFLRELVEKMARDNNHIVRIIREVEKPYYATSWYPSYSTWCGTATCGTVTISGDDVGNTTSGNLPISGAAAIQDFSSIKTF